MKNRICPQKNHCFGYTNGCCEGCAVGDKLIKQRKKIDRLKAENEKLKAEIVRLNTIINPNF